MGPLLVVEGQISPNPLSGLSPILVCLQVHLLVLDAAPQPFHEDVVHAPAPAVHAHLNALRQQHAGEGLAGELAALVGVEDLWPTLAQGLFQSRNTEVYLQGVGQPPSQHVAAVPVHDGHQVEETPSHGYVGDVGGPHLVDPVDLQPPEQVRQEIEMQKDLCVVLDLCSPSDDLLQIQVDLQVQAALGFYQSDEDSLTVITDDGGPEPLSWLIYSHEYAHALQDQAYDLSILRDGRERLDAARAVLALAEGDANLTEYLFYESLPREQQTLLAEALESKSRQFSESEAIAQAPRYITEPFGWEHSAGAQFVFRLYLEGGLEAVEEAFLDPPVSSEQVIHPEKYLAGEPPRQLESIDLAPALGGTWNQESEGVLGELLVGVYLGAFVHIDQGLAAAEGWGGDRYNLLKDDQGRLLIAMRFVWDTVDDAKEFAFTVLEFVEQKSQGLWDLVEAEETEDRSTGLWVGDGISVYLSHEAAGSTLIVVGPDRESVEAAVTEAGR